MPIQEPLDMSRLLDEDIETDYQLEIAKPSEPNRQLEIPSKRDRQHCRFLDDEIDDDKPSSDNPSELAPKQEIPSERNQKYSILRDDEIDGKIKEHQSYFKTLQLTDFRKLEKAIEDLQKEKLVREREKNRQEEARLAVKLAVNGDNGRPKSTRTSTLNCKSVSDIYAKTDGSGSRSKDHVANGTAFSEECVLINPHKGKGPFTQRSPNTDGSTVIGRKDTSKIFSNDLAGPSPRPGLRSGSKLFSQFCGSCIDSTCKTCRFYRKPQKRHFAAKEVREGNSATGSGRKGNGVKRARQSVGGGDSPEKVVELFSSEDEEVKVTRKTFADCEIASQRKVYGTRSALSPSMEGVRIAYPSRDDPEAVEVAYHDLHRLEPMEFLNDTVIDFYIKYIQRPEVLTLEDKNKFYFFNSFFYKKLSDVVGGQNKKTLADLTKLRKWTKGTNIFEKHYLFVPIHDKWHWSLAIVCHPGATSEDTGSQRCILHLDSMSPGHKSNNVFRLLRTYLIAEWEHQGDKDGVRDSLERLNIDDFKVNKTPVPQQENESDCGLFLLHYIERFLKEAPSSFKLTDVDQGGLFGRNWFKPSQASGLRGEIQQLLLEFFEKEASGAKENAETIEESENTLQNSIQQVNHSDVEVIKAGSPGQCFAAELVHEHNVPPAYTQDFDSSGGSTPPGLLVECADQHLESDLERWACSQDNCGELPRASVLESSADFLSSDFLGARRGPLSRSLVDYTEDVNMLYLSNSRDRDFGGDDLSGIPLVVDLSLQERRCSLD